MDALNDPDIHTIVFMSSAQVGKALPLTVPIATPDGWSVMGDLQVGDKVFDSNGDVCNVTFATDIMNDRSCCQITFSDATVITTDVDHQWEVVADNKVKVVTTGDMLQDFKKNNRNKYAVKVNGAINCSEKELPIAPYILGLWLGDGHSASSRIFCHSDDAEHYVREIERIGHETLISVNGCHEIRIDPKKPNICSAGHNKDLTGWNGRGCAECGRTHARNYVRKKHGSKLKQDILPVDKKMPMLLRTNNLIGNKHIPKAYLRSSYSQRLELLQGLMDTGGYIGKRGRCEFVTTSINLKHGVEELLYSLGIKHTISDKQPACTYKGEKVKGKQAYRFSFMVYEDKPVFRIPRKLSLMASREGGRATEVERRKIIDICQVNSVPVRCIQVDSDDHLYLAGKQMIPTHNTEVLLNIIGYFIHQDPSSIIVMQPTTDMGQAFSKDRVAAMFRDTPAIRDKIANPKSRDSGNTVLHKKFDGGQLTIVGSNSPSQLASRPIRVVLCDEVDRYPPSAGTEGDPVNLVIKRSTTFWNRKIVMTSTPTIKGGSRIELAYNNSDQRKYYVKCPECDENTLFMNKHMMWDSPEEITFCCEHCGGMIPESKKHDMLKNGEWIATEESDGVAGFWINEYYSPWSSWSKITKEFLKAKQNPETLRTFVNTSWGETWEEAGDTVEYEYIYSRREDYGVEDGQLPYGVSAITMGADVQKDRIEYEIVGWCDGEESYSLEYGVLRGSPSQMTVWDELDLVMERTWIDQMGNELRIASAGIDSGGHHTQVVYDFCRPRTVRRIYAVKGVAGEGKPVAKISRLPQRNIELLLIGVDSAKEMVYSRLQIEDVGFGYCHFKKEYEKEFFKQLCSEKVVTKYVKGFPRRAWVKTRTRNEALDCRVYALAVMKKLNINWNVLNSKLNSDKNQDVTPDSSGLIDKSDFSDKFQKKRMKRFNRPKRSFAKGWG
jgi:phage terminase large subunit GpA-like protein